MTPILEARGLTKRFGQTQALAGLDLVVSPGRVVALLGPNGAGKTTFVRAVATLLRPDAGTLHVDGIDALRQPARVRQLVGLAGQFAAVEEAMTGRENLQMVGRLFGLSRQDAKAAAVRGLEPMKLARGPEDPRWGRHDRGARPRRRPSPGGLRRAGQDRPRSAGSRRAAVNTGAGLWVSSLVVAGRMVRKFARTPQLIVFTTIQSAL